MLVGWGVGVRMVWNVFHRCEEVFLPLGAAVDGGDDLDFGGRVVVC